MKLKTLILNLFICFFLIVITDFFANIMKLRPVLWKTGFYSYLNVGWYTWHGADHLYDNEIHKKQTNGFKTRGLKPNKDIKKNIILMGDSFIETSHKIETMPEKYLRDFVIDSNVISFGSWGWSTDQQLLHLKEHIKTIKPEKVILLFQRNDLKENISKHGFLGSKPTFDIKKDKDKLILTGPNLNNGKNYLEYSYFYRAINKVIGRIKLRNQETFLDVADTCNKNTNEYDKLESELKNFYNKKHYTRKKEIHNHHEKPYARKVQNDFVDFETWQSSKIENYLNYDLKTSRSNSVHTFNDPFYFNSEIMTSGKEKRELLTNKLLNEIQKVSVENNANFYLVFNNLKSLFQPFSSEKQYTFCYNNKELIYSNKAFYDKFDRVFKNLNNVMIINFEDEFKNKYYDLFDGHYNDDANKFIMKKVANFINN